MQVNPEKANDEFCLGAQKQKDKSMEQDRKPKNEPMHL